MDIDLQRLLRASTEGVVKEAAGHTPMKIGSCTTSTTRGQYLIYHKSVQKCTFFFSNIGKASGSTNPRSHSDLCLPPSDYSSPAHSWHSWQHPNTSTLFSPSYISPGSRGSIDVHHEGCIWVVQVPKPLPWRLW